MPRVKQAWEIIRTTENGRIGIETREGSDFSTLLRYYLQGTLTQTVIDAMTPKIDAGMFRRHSMSEIVFKLVLLEAQDVRAHNQPLASDENFDDAANRFRGDFWRPISYIFFCKGQSSGIGDPWYLRDKNTFKRLRLGRAIYPYDELEFAELGYFILDLARLQRRGGSAQEWVTPKKRVFADLRWLFLRDRARLRVAPSPALGPLAAIEANDAASLRRVIKDAPLEVVQLVIEFWLAPDLAESKPRRQGPDRKRRRRGS